MKNFIFTTRKKLTNFMVLFTSVVTIWSFVAIAYAGEPGSVDDPIVSQSYVDGKITQINSEIATLKAPIDQINTLKNDVNSLKTEISSLKTEINSLKTKVETLSKDQGSSSQAYQIIEVKLNKKIILGNSTELILRSGKAKAISGLSGGLSDLTSDAGLDLKTGALIPTNHLILSPREDGRGITITSANAWVMIKGKYSLE